jgi:hypothetical protein
MLSLLLAIQDTFLSLKLAALFGDVVQKLGLFVIFPPNVQQELFTMFSIPQLQLGT